MYFTWWTNRKDAADNSLFQGGFLGLDNISVIDRSHIEALEAQLGRGVELYQSDGTSWMGMFSRQMMELALKLDRLGNPEYARLAGSFFRHFVFITEAMNSLERRSGGRSSCGTRLTACSPGTTSTSRSAWTWTAPT